MRRKNDNACNSMFRHVVILVLLLAPIHADEFFEKKIRPLLVERCYECHGEKKQKGGLRLDSREGWQKGGDTGPAIVPGEPEKSLLIKAVRYQDQDLQMPPKNRLSDAQTADLELWIKSGANDPRTGTVAVVEAEKGRGHWAYQAPVKSAVPEIKDNAWAHNDIDRFIRARVEAPAADVDKASLLRRVYFDLTGLPPSIEELNDFLKDRTGRAFEKVVDRLLASDRFGERWGRHWLDVGRFAESVTLRGFVFKEAWRYRDYVIDAFNRDVPYDQFVREQIAGDLMEGGSIAERQRRMIATTFLMLGNTNLEEQDKKQLDMDFVDEQLDVLGKAFLAQTIGCARCHDHKFDPIPTKDYYAMAGILRTGIAMEHANVSAWVERDLPLPASEEAQFIAGRQKMEALKSRLAALEGKGRPTSPVLPSELPGIVIDDEQARHVGEWTRSTHFKNFVGVGYIHDANQGKGSKTLTFAADKLPAGKYAVRLAYVEGDNRTTKLPVEILHADGETTVHVNQQQAPPIAGRFVSLGQFRFEGNGQGYVLISTDGTTGHVIADAVQFLPVDQISVETAKTGDEAEVKRLKAEMKKLEDQTPKRPRAMGLKENPRAEDLRVHIRGSVHNLGEVAPRGFLKVAALVEPPANPSRLEFAEWLGGTNNPLAARVMVNRVWGWLLGKAIVESVDNFGTTGASPIDRELLDYLAVRFAEDGWSIKKLIRQIVTSHTYRQSLAEPRALDAESLRDAILAVTGELDLKMGGSAFPATLTADYGYSDKSKRRSVYLPVFRNSLPEIFEAFDFPDPSMVVGKRNQSAVAQQALYLMNSPWISERAEVAAKASLAIAGLKDEERIESAYLMAFSRPPTKVEQAIALNIIKVPASGENIRSESVKAWKSLWHGVFASVEFRFLN